MLRIGITSDINLIPTYIQRNKGAQIVPKNVLEVIERNGALPITFPITKKDFIPELVSMVDGIILTGGLDVQPNFYKEKPISNDDDTYRPRDEFELHLVQEAVDRHKAILGLCRGEQVINVALGGTLYQNLKEQRGNSNISHEQKEPGHLPTHYIDIRSKTRLFQSLYDYQFVNSRHHQAIKTLGTGLIVSAHARDGVIEAIENESGTIQGVQWHPEDLWQENPTQENLFIDFLSRCHTHASSSIERSLD